MTCGVYEIVNTSNGDRYVGSSLNVEARWKRHCSELRKGGHPNPRLQNVWNKYGGDRLTFSPILYCAPSTRLFYEQRAIDGYHPEYNISPIAGAPMSGRTHSEQAKVKMSTSKLGVKKSPEYLKLLSARMKGTQIWLGKRHTPETIVKMSKAGRDRKHTDATKKKLRDLNTGKRYAPPSSETRKRISAALKGRLLSVEWRANISKANTGKKHPFSEEHRKNLSVAVTAAWARRKLGEKHGE